MATMAATRKVMTLAVIFSSIHVLIQIMVNARSVVPWLQVLTGEINTILLPSR